jgi:glycosyltransferase involved in cell wall biosynthesis
VYNEADRIGDCLRAIAVQTVQPYEVIVVDNNSTDGTVAIARRFPFVRLVHEYRQGVVHARTHGFDAARGDIIGRIDADTIIPADWVERVQSLFADPGLDAVSGRIHYRDVAFGRMVSRIDLAFRRYLADRLGREVALQGSNMALRRTTWRRVRADLCARAGQHEDFDLAVHINQLDGAVRFDESLEASIGFRQCGSGWRGFLQYAVICPDTYRQHGLASRRYMWRVLFVVVGLYPVLWLLYKGYDTGRQRFSWVALLRGRLTARVNPATFVE